MWGARQAHDDVTALLHRLRDRLPLPEPPPPLTTIDQRRQSPKRSG